MKNTLERFNGRPEKAEEQIIEMEDKAKELTQTEQQNLKRIKKSKCTLIDLWDNKKSNIHITEGEKIKLWKVFKLKLLPT